jgi:hypothetical protein
MSTNAAKNNFIFADADPQHDAASVSNYFYFVNSSDALIGNQAYAVNYNNGDVAFDQPTSNATWSLVAHRCRNQAASPCCRRPGLVGAVTRRQWLDLVPSLTKRNLHVEN